MAALILASSLFSAVTTFYNRNTIEETLLSWLRSPSVEVWLGETATEVIAALIKKGHAAANQKEVVSALTWSDAVLLMLSGFVLGFCCGWYFRGPRTATPITAQPLQQLVVQNIIQVDRLQQAIIRGRRRSASQPACHRRRQDDDVEERQARGLVAQTNETKKKLTNLQIPRSFKEPIKTRSSEDHQSWNDTPWSRRENKAEARRQQHQIADLSCPVLHPLVRLPSVSQPQSVESKTWQHSS
ncbi:uncharacterized protein [Dermacentor albipictus]|uniref:uncharacterized protein isoform X2 n=1 Tax=Dermacentor albipictus TaxID=60249 RepID=UPI0038FC1D1D